MVVFFICTQLYPRAIGGDDTGYSLMEQITTCPFKVLPQRRAEHRATCLISASLRVSTVYGHVSNYLFSAGKYIAEVVV